ncbi:hypothetical protein GLOTRDRAFT_123986 [Gloeophyllum trabeum ATCC 11539]|uniref:Uncharacterized protein n=1 Tax=Gloeophyllum trabeum (strain ATCC 11539 / FP-39264 / Madison 617) TaxID=670483 RepID=S7QLI6_GLOTA|nr:uncharacterized protein GLOTRDRAFT_123986 [Gloeophyllum trabeum ATCC 11539]EPQ60232.1 hypothetical protein GLOTRDRAFT_123986 [Gloeophyllum trabeum ATCC 11539]
MLPPSLVRPRTPPTVHDGALVIPFWPAFGPTRAYCAAGRSSSPSARPAIPAHSERDRSAPRWMTGRLAHVSHPSEYPERGSKRYKSPLVCRLTDTQTLPPTATCLLTSQHLYLLSTTILYHPLPFIAFSMRIASGSSILFASLALTASGAPVNEGNAESHPNSPRPSASGSMGGKVSGGAHIGRGLPSTIAARDASPLCSLEGMVKGIPIIGDPVAGIVNTLVGGCDAGASSQAVTTQSLADTECIVKSIVTSLPSVGSLLRPIIDGIRLCPDGAGAESVNAQSAEPLDADKLEQIAAAVSQAAASIEAAHSQPTGKSRRQLPVPEPAPSTTASSSIASVSSSGVAEMAMPTPPIVLPVSAPGAPALPVPPNTPESSSSSTMPSSTSLSPRQLLPVQSSSGAMSSITSDSAAPTQMARRTEDEFTTTTASDEVLPSSVSPSTAQSDASAEPTLGARQLPPALPVNPPALPVSPPSLPINPPSLPINPPSLPVNPPVNPPMSSSSTSSTVPSDASSTGMAQRDLPTPPALPINAPVQPPSAPVSPPSAPVSPPSPPSAPAPAKDAAGKTPASDAPVFHFMGVAAFGPEMTASQSASSAGSTSTSA